MPVARGSALPPDAQYPYHSRRFLQLLEESYNEHASREAAKFYAWMEEAYKHSSRRFPGKESLAFSTLLPSLKHELSGISDPLRKAERETEICAWLHGLIKEIIPKFNLDTGYEFYNAVKLAERQCFLQSVLIAGILQDAGMNAGVAMVYKSMQGQVSNNGHAVTLVKLADEKDVLVDASDKEPFAAHQGLFAKGQHYLYVIPVYEKKSVKIQYYMAASENKNLSAAHIKALDFSFVRSQFWFYRGERAKGGLLSKVKTKEGLKASERALKKSIRICPRNPLSVYTLGKIYLMEKKVAKARRLFERARNLYAAFGWVPDGVKEFLKLSQEEK